MSCSVRTRMKVTEARASCSEAIGSRRYNTVLYWQLSWNSSRVWCTDRRCPYEAASLTGEYQRLTSRSNVELLHLPPVYVCSETAHPTHEPKRCPIEACQRTHFGEKIHTTIGRMGEYTRRSVGTGVVLCTYYANLAR